MAEFLSDKLNFLFWLFCYFCSNKASICFSWCIDYQISAHDSPKSLVMQYRRCLPCYFWTKFLLHLKQGSLSDYACVELLHFQMCLLCFLCMWAPCFHCSFVSCIFIGESSAMVNRTWSTPIVEAYYRDLTHSPWYVNHYISMPHLVI